MPGWSTRASRNSFSRAHLDVTMRHRYGSDVGAGPFHGGLARITRGTAPGCNPRWTASGLARRAGSGERRRIIGLRARQYWSFVLCIT